MTRANVAPGCRRLTPDHHRAADIAARFAGLPAGITRKSQLLAALKRASEALGLTARLRDAVDTLMGWSQEQDWQSDSRPIVWPSNQRLEDAWGVGRRQVQNTLDRLIRLGLIAAVDGPQGRRGGRRDEEGRIVEAFGFDLSPLAVRHAEFLAAAAEHRERCAQRAALRRRLTIAQKAIRQIAATAIEQQAPGRDWAHWLRHAEGRCRRPAPRLDLEVLPGLVGELEAVRQEGYAVLTAFLKSLESAPSGALDCAPYTATNQRPADESATSNDAVCSDPAGERRGSARSPHLQRAAAAPPTGRPTAASRVERATAALGERISANLASPPDRPRPPASSRSPATSLPFQQLPLGGGRDDAPPRIAPPGSAGRPQQPRPNTTTAALAPRLLLRLSPPLGDYLSTERPAWADVVDAADHLRSQLGISRDAWIDACHTLGRQDAAAAVAVIAAKRSAIRSPGGYLRAMTERARDGQLNLLRSLWGLAEGGTDA